MVTRSERLGDFVPDREPAPDVAVQLLCEDHVGTYVVPFPCRRTEGAWLNVKTGEAIDAVVVGWRELQSGLRKTATTPRGVD
jgi:hypothetical protein